MEILDPQRFVPGMEIEPAHLEPVMVRRLKEDLVGWAIDTHDREVLAWTASPRGIGGIAVRDLMLLAVERRFGTLAAPQPVEWLADNGSCFTAHETLAFAHAIRLVPCFTPVRSPESNGIAEAFVKTFKRDYVRLNLTGQLQIDTTRPLFACRLRAKPELKVVLAVGGSR